MSEDTISRKAAIAEIARWIGYIDEDMIGRIQTGLKRLPSSQPEVLACGEGELIAQPEIIRCKGCKNWNRESICDGFCSEDCMRHDEDFYCGYAERKTDERSIP